jgi:hypothetical protein
MLFSVRTEANEMWTRELLLVLHSGRGSIIITIIIIIIIIIIISGVGLSPLGTAATSGLLYKPQMIDEGDCGAIGGMKIGRGKNYKITLFSRLCV